MARVASLIVSKRVLSASLALFALAAAQFVLSSCEPDEFAPVGAKVAHAAR